MKRLIFYFLILLAAVWLGLKLQANSGYILISYKHLSIQTTLWFAILSTLMAFIVLYFLFRGIGSFISIPKRIKLFFQRNATQKYLLKLDAGIMAFLMDDWKRMEKNISRAIKYNKHQKFSNYLLAAIAADKQNRYDQRDEYLLEAMRHYPSSDDITTELLRAKFAIKQNQWDEALSILVRAKQKQPENKLLLHLLQTVYIELHGWENLLTLIPSLRALKVLPKVNLIRLERDCYAAILIARTAERNAMSVEEFWHQIPRHFRKDPQVLAAYIDHLLLTTDKISRNKTEGMLRHFLKKNFHEKIVEQYSNIKSERSIKQLKLVERLLKNYGDNVMLLICLGRICKNQMLWGKAKNYLEKALKIAPSALIYDELAQVMERQGDKETAAEYYRSGVKLLISEQI